MALRQPGSKPFQDQLQTMDALRMRGLLRCIAALGAAGLLLGCGSNNSHPLPPAGTPAFNVGGTISGLRGIGLVLQDNGKDDLALASNGPFSFATSIPSGSSYTVIVKTQPVSPSQTCTINGGSGTVTGSAITSIAIVCSTDSYPVGGTVSGLLGTGLVLQNNASNDLAIGANGSFTFTSPVASGAQYAVTIKTLPSAPSQTCSLTSNSGTITNGPVTNVAVVCSAPRAPSVGRFLYVGDHQTSNISAYTINASAGSLTEITGSPYLQASSPRSAYPTALAADPSGKFLYVANGTGTISLFTIDSSASNAGALTLAGTISPRIYQNVYQNDPEAIAVDPSGRFVYTANFSSQSVSAFSIEPSTGALTELTTSPLPVGAGVGGGQGLTVDPTGGFLYVSDSGGGLSAFSINSTTGVLTPFSASPYFTGSATSPFGIAVAPSGRFVYVANSAGGTAEGVIAFARDPATGAISTPGTRLPPAGVMTSFGFHPSKPLAYLVNSRFGMTVFNVDGTTGNLTVASSPAINPGSGTTTLERFAIDPSGTFAYVTATGGAVGRVLEFSVDATTGALTQLTSTAEAGAYPSGRNPSGLVIVR